METENIQAMRMQCLNLAFQIVHANNVAGKDMAFADVLNIAGRLLKFLETGK